MFHHLEVVLKNLENKHQTVVGLSLPNTRTRGHPVSDTTDDSKKIEKRKSDTFSKFVTPVKVEVSPKKKRDTPPDYITVERVLI